MSSARIVRDLAAALTKGFLAGVLSAAALGWPAAAPALEPAKRSLTIIGRASSVVQAPSIRLKDIAEITSINQGDTALLSNLSGLELERSPEPGKQISLRANDVLSKIRMSGADLSRIGYSFPTEMTVSRAARRIALPDVKQAIELALGRLGRDVTLRDVRMPAAGLIVPAESSGIEVAAAPTDKNGHFDLDIRIGSGESQARFNLTAIADEWRQMPVARSAITKGSLISDKDVELARMNIAQLPRDALSESEIIIGQAATRSILQGAFFRQGMLSEPAAIEAGSRVILRYKDGPLEATASGTALESGGIGHEIRVRNESSKRIISGTIIEPGLVGVK